MVKFCCDKCGKVLKETSHKKDGLGELACKLMPKGDGWYFDKDTPIYLCDKCEEDFYKFLYGEKPEKKEEVEETKDDLPF